jgi:membrane protease YdiL (CAAX protease family)
VNVASSRVSLWRVLLLFVFAKACSWSALAVAVNAGMSPPAVDVLAQGLELVVFFAGLWSLAPQRSLQWHDMFFPTDPAQGGRAAVARSAWLLLPAWFAFGMLLKWTWVALQGVLPSSVGWVDQQSAIAAPGTPLLAWMSQAGNPAWSAVILAPLREELIYRGVILRIALGRLATPWAVLLASVAFALPHGSGFGYALATGVVLAAVYLKARSLLAAIAAHAGCNFFVYFGTYLPAIPHRLVAGLDPQWVQILSVGSALVAPAFAWFVWRACVAARPRDLVLPHP